jgi:hypothetical protein
VNEPPLPDANRGLAWESEEHLEWVLDQAALVVERKLAVHVKTIEDLQAEVARLKVLVETFKPPPRAKLKCSEEGCKRGVHSAGLCVAHYYRAWRRKKKLKQASEVIVSLPHKVA